MELNFLIAFIVVIVGVLLFIFGYKQYILARYKQIRELIETGNLDRALSILNSIIERDFNNYRAHYYRGLVYTLRNEYELALEEFQKVLSIGEYDNEINEVIIREKLVEIYIKLNNNEEAQKELALLIQLEPENTDYYFKMGLLYYERGRYQQALGNFVKVLEINPNDLLGNFYTGLLYYKNHQYQEAMAHFDKTLDLDPRFVRAYFYRGMVQYNLKQYTQAIKDFDSSIQDPDHKIETQTYKGLSLIALDSLDMAIKEFRQGLEYIQEENEAARLLRYNLGDCLEKSNDAWGAVEQWEKIVKVKPDYKDVAKRLANYEVLRMDDYVKDFYNCSIEQFEETCFKLANILKIDPIHHKVESSEFCEIYGQNRLSWKERKEKGTLKTLMHIYRAPEPLGFNQINKLRNQRNNLQAHNAYILSPTNFTSEVVNTVKDMDIKLLDGNDIAELLREMERKEAEKSNRK